MGKPQIVLDKHFQYIDGDLVASSFGYIKIKNFLSFKDEVCFSFEATNDKFAEESQVVTINENTRLLRFAIIYGYNASGKSNLLRALDFLLYFWSFKPKDLDSG